MQVELLAAPVRDGCAPRRRKETHTHTDRTLRAGEGVESWNGITSGNKQAKHAFVLFARSLRLLAESTRSRHAVF